MGGRGPEGGGGGGRGGGGVEKKPGRVYFVWGGGRGGGGERAGWVKRFSVYKSTFKC